MAKEFKSTASWLASAIIGASAVAVVIAAFSLAPALKRGLEHNRKIL